MGQQGMRTGVDHVGGETCVKIATQSQRSQAGAWKREPYILHCAVLIVIAYVLTELLSPIWER